ncbi:hypothetical protein [Bradyrhizobium sp. STM 3566]|uniref:hypothetical protein n=1 Tax=Bradyrhizobium sp. STM 3566 TaxID=578928 RepID=UPI00388DE829
MNKQALNYLLSPTGASDAEEPHRYAEQVAVDESARYRPEQMRLKVERAGGGFG